MGRHDILRVQVFFPRGKTRATSSVQLFVVLNNAMENHSFLALDICNNNKKKKKQDGIRGKDETLSGGRQTINEKWHGEERCENARDITEMHPQKEGKTNIDPLHPQTNPRDVEITFTDSSISW